MEQRRLTEPAYELLTRAVELGAGERSRLELCLRLIEQGQPTQALRLLDAIQSPHYPIDFALLRGVAHHALLQFTLADDELASAQKLGLPPEELQSWRDHLYEDGPPPPLPYRQNQAPQSAPFDEPEPTHLIDLNSPDYSSDLIASPNDETIVRPALRSSQLASPDDETIVRPRPQALDDLEIANEKTSITTLPDPISASRDNLFLSTPNMPDTVERAAEMPRYATQNAPIQPGPDSPDSDESSPFLHGALAAMPFAQSETNQNSPAPQDLELDLELDLPATPSKSTAPPAAQSPANEPGSAYGPVRQFTVYMRDRAPRQFTVILQSPARALTIATLTALFVLCSGALIIYSLVGNTQLSADLDTAQFAIDADLYSSHLATVRDLNQLASFQVIENDTIDQPLRSLTAKLPFLGFDDKLTRAKELAIFTRARQGFRFEHPGSLSFDELPEATSPLLAAARAYLHLANDNPDQALTIIDQHLASHSQDPFIALAITDILVETSDKERLTNFVETATDQTAATAFLRAKALLLLEDERAPDLIRTYSESSFPDHVGLQLTLAALTDDSDEAEKILSALTDPGHPHASRTERAQAFLHRATRHFQNNDPQAARRDLERAAHTAPLHPFIARQLIDDLLRTGDILEARAHLARQPSGPELHPYFDLAIARIDFLIGDHERAERRLEPHLTTSPDAAAYQAIIFALNHDLENAQALINQIDGSPIGNITKTWLTTACEIEEDAADLFEAVQDLDTQSLSPTARALLSESYRLAASQASSRNERRDLLNLASDSLGSQIEDHPETRIQACLIALDQRSQSDSEEACQLLASRDLAVQQAIHALIRWHRYERRDDDAQAVLESHIENVGPSTATRILQAHHHIRKGEFDDARAILDALPTADIRHPQRHIAAGTIALQTGRFQTAAEHFQSAIDNSALRRPQALLGLARAKIHLDELSPELESSIRSALRDGEFGPLAWTTFAAFRRTQNRISDARENIAFAEQALANFGTPQEELLILTEKLAQEERRRRPGHRALLPLLNDLESRGADSWFFHHIAANWHQAQRRPDRQRLNHHRQRAEALQSN